LGGNKGVCYQVKKIIEPEKKFGRAREKLGKGERGKGAERECDEAFVTEGRGGGNRPSRDGLPRERKNGGGGGGI